MEKVNCSVSLKERFPFLARWKQKGFQEFPTFPPNLILRYIALFGLDEKRLRQSIQKALSKSPFSFIPLPFTYTKERFKELEDYYVMQGAILMAFLRMGRATEKEKDKIVNTVIKQRGRIGKGESKKEAQKTLGNEVLPNTKGGKEIYSMDEKVILKYIYRELNDCIKSIRKNLWIPLKKVSYYGQEKPDVESIKESIPDILDIFCDEEIPILIDQKFSVSDSSLEIISKRLRKAYRWLKPRSIENILNKVLPKFTPNLST